MSQVAFDSAPQIKPWKLGLLAGMASYLDAGAIVAVSVSLAIWQAKYGMSPFEVGLAPALLTISVAIGSFIGGSLGDRIGRKRIYAVDLLVFCAGLAVLLLAPNAAVLFVGLVIAGVAIGADVPTSLALVGEMAPPEKRGSLLIVTQIMWGLGPGITLLLATLFGAALGANLPYLLFGQCLFFGLLTWALRRGLKESTAWKAATGSFSANRSKEEERAARRELWSPAVIKALVFTGSFFLILTMFTSFLGSFSVYYLMSVGGMSVSEASFWSLIGIPISVVSLFILMPLMDGRRRRLAFYIGAVASIVIWGLPVLTGGAVWSFVVAMVGTAALGVWASEPHYKVWSQELFPTLLRGTAQGITFGTARLLAAAGLVFVPTVLANDPMIVLWIIFGLVVAYCTVGILWQPKASTQNLAATALDAELTEPVKLP